MKANSNYLLYR